MYKCPEWIKEMLISSGPGTQGYDQEKFKKKLKKFSETVENDMNETKCCKFDFDLLEDLDL